MWCRCRRDIGSRCPSTDCSAIACRPSARPSVWRRPEAATEGQLALAHEPAWIDAVLQGTLTESQRRELGFPWSPAMAERAQRSVGATIGAARAALREGVAAQLAGGSASRSRGQGQRLVRADNDVAVAARLMQAEWHSMHRELLRVLVIDLDVHQGDGTAAIFRGRSHRLHAVAAWREELPGAQGGERSRRRAARRMHRHPFLHALDEALGEAWSRHGDRPPRLVFYLAGADPHEADRLGRLALTRRGPGRAGIGVCSRRAARAALPWRW